MSQIKLTEEEMLKVEIDRKLRTSISSSQEEKSASGEEIEKLQTQLSELTNRRVKKQKSKK